MTMGELITLLDPQFLFLCNGAFVSTWHGVQEKPIRKCGSEPSAVPGVWLHPNLFIPSPSDPLYFVTGR